MTSNLASTEIAEHALQLRRQAEDIARERYAGNIEDQELGEKITISRHFKDKIIQPILKYHFGRDEFLGRINEMVYFLPFSRSELLVLVERELELWAARAKTKHGMELSWEPAIAQESGKLKASMAVKFVEDDKEIKIKITREDSDSDGRGFVKEEKERRDV